MEQVLELILPKKTRPLCPGEIESDPEKRVELLFWQNQLDLLASGKVSWEAFVQNLEGGLVSHPAVRRAAAEDGQTFLHLAVQAGRIEYVKELAADPYLKLRKNRFGLTPLEIAQFLNRKECAHLLCAVPERTFGTLFPEVEEQLPHLEYLTHPVFEKDEVLKRILTRTQKAKAQDEIPPEKIWMGIYFDKEIQKGLHPPVSIRFLDNEVGWGAFAEKRIPPCAFVGEYTGVVKERKRKHLKEKVYCVRYTTWDGGVKKYVIDAEEKGNFTRFINHSAKPNLGLQSVYWRGLPRMIFVAVKEIQEGAQLTFDYGSFFWKECCQTPKLFE